MHWLLIAPLFFFTATQERVEFPLKHVKPSVFLRKFWNRALVAPGFDVTKFKATADDHRSVIIVEGADKEAQTLLKDWLPFFDVESRIFDMNVTISTATHDVLFEGRIGGANATLSKVVNERSELVVEIKPRINGDATVTYFTKIEFGGKEASCVFRCRQGQTKYLVYGDSLANLPENHFKSGLGKGSGVYIDDTPYYFSSPQNPGATSLQAKQGFVALGDKPPKSNAGDLIISIRGSAR